MLFSKQLNYYTTIEKVLQVLQYFAKVVILRRARSFCGALFKRIFAWKRGISKRQFIEIVSLLVVLHLSYSKYEGVKVCFYSCRYQNQTVSLVSHSSRSCSIRVAIVSFLQHSCRTCVALVSHLCCQCRIRVARVWHSCCKLDQIVIISPFTPSRNSDRDVDHKTDILNNLDLEGMEICSKNSFSKIEQSELLKLIDGRTVIINLQIRGPSSSSFY